MSPGATRFVERWQNYLPPLGILAVAAFALRRIDDFDTWWHLAAGRWIAENGSVPWTDTLSFTVPDHEWLNLQWLFDLGLYGLWSLGGADLLVVACVMAFSTAAYFMGRTLQLSVGPVLTALLLAWLAAMANERFTVRPEMATFPLLALVWWLIARARSEQGRNLWLLVPVMVAWVNLHSLFILGLAVIGAHVVVSGLAVWLPLPTGLRIGSAWEEPARKRLWMWGAVAIVATLLNPYGYHALLFPLELFTRISGTSREVFSAIGEFRGPWSGYFPTFALGAYQAFFVFSCAAVGLAFLVALVPEPRKGRHEGAPPVGLDLAAVGIFVVLAYLSVLARRNVGVFAVGALPVTAQALALLWQRLPAAVQAASRSVNLMIGGLFSAAMVPLLFMVVTNSWYAEASEQHEFGFGVFEENFPIRATEFFEEHDLPAPLYNDMTAGGYLTWARPTEEGVYIDGRLEVYDPSFFSVYIQTLGNPQAWLTEAERWGINSAMLFHRWGNRDRLILTLNQHPSWSLVYFDEVAVVFVNTDRHREKAVSTSRTFLGTVALANRERLLKRAGGFAIPLARTVGLFAYARILQLQGDEAGATEAFEAILKLSLATDQILAARQELALMLARRGNLEQARFQLQQGLAVVPGDPGLSQLLARVEQAMR